MRRHSLLVKFFVGNLLIGTLVIAVAGEFSYRSINAQHLRAVYAWQDYLAEVAQQYLEHVWPASDPAEYDRISKQFFTRAARESAGAMLEAGIESGTPARLTVMAEDGRVLGDSRGMPAEMENHKTADRPEVLAALEGRTGRDVRRSETLGAEYRYVAMPVRHNGRVVGAVRVSMPVVAIVESQAVLRDTLVWASVAAIAAFALLGLLINWMWYFPLKRIALAARQMASGDLARRARTGGSDELAQLGAALNAMRDNLVHQIETVKTQGENFERVVANLREGVIALDAGGRIVLMNRAAMDLLAPGEAVVVGQHLQTVVRVTGIVGAYNEAMTAGRPVSRQVETDVRGRRHLDVHISPLVAGGAGGIAGLVVVRDVTDLVRAAAMKAEFVANASHELRTPLATLRAAVDSLAATGPGDRDALAKLTAMLDRGVRRLEDLTLDLLNLHLVESGKRELSLESVRLASLEAWARSHFAEAAAEKGVALEVQVVPPDGALVTDRRLLELVLQNLIDNGVKFTPPGGRVICLIERQGHHVRLRVVDTGCGISRQDQAHVFERFFQAEFSRSRETAARGTGLGLAIVKHACERLGATLDLESELGRGTTVTVLVPDRAAEAGEQPPVIGPAP